jgi:hypothetical protein
VDLLFLIVDSYEYSDGKGLPLGNQTSQWFALYYLDSIDRIIKEQLRIKYYTRYMDDFVLLHHDKAYLQQILESLREFATNELGLEFNKKTQICPIKNGIKHLGFHVYLTETGKVIRKVSVQTKKRYKRLLKKISKDYAERKVEFGFIKARVNSYNTHLKHGHTYKLRNKLSWETVYRR